MTVNKRLERLEKEAADRQPPNRSRLIQMTPVELDRAGWYADLDALDAADRARLREMRRRIPVEAFHREYSLADYFTPEERAELRGICSKVPFRRLEERR